MTTTAAGTTCRTRRGSRRERANIRDQRVPPHEPRLCVREPGRALWPEGEVAARVEDQGLVVRRGSVQVRKLRDAAGLHGGGLPSICMCMYVKEREGGWLMRVVGGVDMDHRTTRKGRRASDEPLRFQPRVYLLPYDQ